MDILLPEGLYPFIDQRLPLGQLVMIEGPAALEQLLRSQAAANETEMIRSTPVEIRCQSAEYPDATFLVCWPLKDDRLHMLAGRS